MDRRKFLQIIGVAGVTAAIPWRFDWQKGLHWAQAQAFMISPALPLWNTPFRGVGPGAIPVAAIDGTPAPVTLIANHYTINIREFTDTIGGGGPTRMWGYNPAKALGINPPGPQTQRNLGGIIVAHKGTPIQITFQNQLSSGVQALRNIIPVDDSVIETGSKAQNRTAVHLHGGHIPWYSDGGPFDWWDSSGNHGPSFLNNAILNPSALPNQAEYYYTMDQSARLIWYHDHAYGLTRINAYAGVESALIVRDKFEADLVANHGLPEYIETSILANPPRPVVELPLIFTDRVFVDSTAIPTLDPTWPVVARPDVQATGSLWYAHVYDPARWRLLTGGKYLPPPNPSVVAEFFGDTMLCNGTVYPTLQVEARPYRLRILNAPNARFMNLQLYQADNTLDGITLNPTTLVPTNPPFTWQGPEPVVAGDATQKVAGTSKCLVIGNEGGFLAKPVALPLNVPFNPVSLQGSILMGSAERLDVVIDFANQAGKSFILYTDAPAPFPVGDPVNDFLPNGTGKGPNTREILKITVVPATTPITPVQLPNNFQNQPAVGGDAWNDTLIYPTYDANGFPTGNPTQPITRTRLLTLNENFDKYGRLQQMLGTTVLQPTGTYGQPLLNTPTETPKAGTTEIWEIYNLTGDTHPIHFHLVNVQVLSRQPFVVKFGRFTKMGTATAPNPEERGWKETVRMNPGEVIRVAMTFTLPPNPPNVTPKIGPPPLGNYNLTSPRTGGYEYVWHCHILEHEEHDMMRPLVVSP
jgi:spore coat protein A, manganese oxidase